MSIEALNWAFETPFGTSTQKFIMVVLANYADAHWSTFVGQERIADETQLGIRTVRRCMAELELAGVIKRQRRYHGRIRTSDRISLVQDWVPANLAGATQAGAYQAGANDDRNGPPVPATVAGYPLVIDEPPVTRVSKVIPPEVERLCDLLADQLAERGHKRPTPSALKGWHRDMDLLTRLDGRTFQKVEQTLRWLHAGKDEVAQFWQINIRSPAKLRKHWDAMRERYEREVKHRKRDGQVQSWSPASAPTGRQFGGSLA